MTAPTSGINNNRTLYVCARIQYDTFYATLRYAILYAVPWLVRASYICVLFFNHNLFPLCNWVIERDIQANHQFARTTQKLSAVLNEKNK